MGRCLRCAEEQRQQGRKEEEIVWETYQGESSRSVPTRAGEHLDDYQAAMRKPAPVRRPAGPLSYPLTSSSPVDLSPSC